MSASSSHNHGDPGGPPIPFHPHSANTQHNTQPSREPPHSHYDFSTILQSRPDSQTQSRPASQTQSPYPTNDSYFNEAFHSTPSPPPTSFLDNILNPVESHTVSFGYRFRDSPPRQRRQSPVVYIQPGDMPTTQRSARLADGFVDLTSLDDSPNDPHTSRRLKRRSPSSGPSTKRVKQNDGTSLKAEDRPEEVTVEEIDLSDDKQTVQDVLQKQREEAVKAQQKPEEKATTFNSFTCVICMDTPTDLTATACGHLFCHTCLMEALIAGENRAAPGEPKRSQCPVCRKIINRSKNTDIIPLLLKKGLATQPRRKNSATVAATAAKVTV